MYFTEKSSELEKGWTKLINIKWWYYIECINLFSSVCVCVCVEINFDLWFESN